MSDDFFKKNGYVLVKNCIPDSFTEIFSQYALFDEKQDFNADGVQVPNAHSKYADPLMESILLYMLPTIEKNTGLKLYPTYSFYRVYRNGDILHPHVDRQSCEISATLCLNYSYEDEKYSWPIIINNKKIDMKPGDMAIYRGIELEHSREQFLPPNDDWHVQTFLHYVDRNGEYAEYKFDKRNNIGEIKKSSKKKYLQFIN